MSAPVPTRSIAARLGAGLLATLLALTLAGLALAWWTVHGLAEEFIVERLAHELDALLADLELDAEGRPLLPAHELNPVFEQPYSGHYFRIAAPGGTLRSRSLWDADLALPPLPADGAPVHTATTGPEAQELLLLARRVRFGTDAVEVAITEDLSGFNRGLRRLGLALAGLATLAFAGLLALQHLIVRRSLAPLEQARRDLQRLGAGTLDRLPDTAPPELQPLIREINRLADQLGTRMQRSRTALGNLAHALKTPLAVLAQLDRHPALHAAPELRAELAQRTRQIENLMQRELKRARIAGSARPGVRTDLAREAEDLVAVLQKLHATRALDFELRLATTAARVDRDDLLELLGNLLDNACQWARSRVRLSARESAGALVLAIEDDGPGVEPDRLAGLGARGSRLDESRAGSGLGLAIAQDIVDSYDGRLELGRSAALGGFRVDVTLPTDR